MILQIVVIIAIALGVMMLCCAAYLDKIEGTRQWPSLI